MPLAYIHLLHLAPKSTLPRAIQLLSSTSPPPLTLSRVIRWIILPTSSPSTHTLLSHPWDLLYITISPDLPGTIIPHLLGHYTLQTGIPSRLTTNFHAHNTTLLHPNPSDVPKLSSSLTSGSQRLGQSTQTLELDAALLDWAANVFKPHGGPTGSGAVSMLNFLAFKEGKDHKESYQRYGKAFAERIGRKRGGTAKLVGNVVGDGKDKDGWDEFALAHYPSIEHFVDMLGSEDYQEVNLRDRVPSLRDTCILCTSEIAVEEIMKEQGGSTGGTGRSHL
jgi:hypothetical protein